MPNGAARIQAEDGETMYRHNGTNYVAQVLAYYDDTVTADLKFRPDNQWITVYGKPWSQTQAEGHWGDWV